MKKHRGAAAKPQEAAQPPVPEPANGDADAPILEKPKLKIAGFEFSDSFTPGPLAVYDATGNKVVSREKRLIDCIPDISKQLDQVVTVEVELNKSDVWELCKRYTKNRKPNNNNLAVLTERMSTGTYVGKYPNLKWDTTPAQVDGKHTELAFLNSTLEKFTFCVALGIDPRMGPRHDTGAARDVVAQGLYLPFDPYVGIKEYNDRKNFMAAAGYITLLLSRYAVWPELAAIRNAKRQLCQHVLGQFVVQQSTRHFSAVRRFIHEKGYDTEGKTVSNEENEAVNEDREGKSWTKAAIITAGTIAFATGRKSLFTQMATGAHLDEGSILLDLNHQIWMLAGEQSAAQREQEQVIQTLLSILGDLRAHELKLEKAPLLLPRIKVNRRTGVTERIYSDHPLEKRKADKLLRQQIAEYWLSQFPKPNEEDLRILSEI